MIAEINGDVDSSELINGWIYKDMEELKEEIMLTCSVSTLSRKMNDLIENGWIDRRRNPKHRWDKRYQYRINLIKISTDLIKIGYILQGYKIDLQMLINANLHSDGAISEITTETTSEITLKTTTINEKESCDSGSENKELKMDLDTDKDFGELAKLYKNCIGQPNGLTDNWINEMLDQYGFEWCKNAMLIAEE